MAPLYAQAATLPADGPLATEVARIRDASPDPLARTTAALRLVQDRIRYVALAMGEGGLVPADAATTWARRFGDCKGKTALLLALLHSFNIQAEPVLVTTVFGDGVDQHLPMIGLFDHVLVRATINGKVYWLDGTRSGDTRLDQLETPNFGWGLPVIPQGAALVRMIPDAYAAPETTTTVRIDASGGLFAPAPIHVEMVARGDEAVAAHTGYSSLTTNATDNLLRNYWRRKFDGLDVTTTTQTFDPQTREVHFVMDGKLRMDWSRGYYELDNMYVGYRADFTREPGPDHDAPFAVSFPAYAQINETILLPPNASGVRVTGAAPIDQTVAGVAYHRRTTLAGAVFSAEVSARTVAPEFPAADAPAAQATLRALANQGVFLSTPSGYQPNAADISAMATAEPTDAAGYVRRGNLYLRSGRYSEAIADFDHAVALDPHDAVALADRGYAHAWRDEKDAANADFAAAEAIEPDNVVVWHGRGVLADRSGASADAIAAYTHALTIEPDDSFSFTRRARIYHQIGDEDHALADSANALRLQPPTTDLYLMRANIYIARHDEGHALAEAQALANIAGDNNYRHVVAAQIYTRLHRADDAAHEFDRALAAHPEAYIYIARASSRPQSDTTGRLADVAEALRLDPADVEALSFKADMQQRQHDYQGAAATLTTALQTSPNSSGLLTLRGVAYALGGRQPLADADFAAARAHASDAEADNFMCWTKAIAGVALESALADCDAGIARRPNSPDIVDSRAFVLLRLGRFDESIAAYNRALELAPRQAASLYGRGIAWERKGDQAKADADYAAARQISEEVVEEFAGYGVTPRALH